MPKTNQEMEYLGNFKAKDCMTVCDTEARLLSVVDKELVPTPISRSSFEIDRPSFSEIKLIRS